VGKKNRLLLGDGRRIRAWGGPGSKRIRERSGKKNGGEKKRGGRYRIMRVRRGGNAFFADRESSEDKNDTLRRVHNDTKLQGRNKKSLIHHSGKKQERPLWWPEGCGADHEKKRTPSDLGERQWSLGRKAEGESEGEGAVREEEASLVYRRGRLHSSRHCGARNTESGVRKRTNVTKKDERPWRIQIRVGGLTRRGKKRARVKVSVSRNKVLNKGGEK